MKYLGIQKSVRVHTKAIVNGKYIYDAGTPQADELFATNGVSIAMYYQPLSGVIELVARQEGVASTWYYFTAGTDSRDRALYRLENNLEILKYKAECIKDAELH